MVRMAFICVVVEMFYVDLFLFYIRRFSDEIGIVIGIFVGSVYRVKVVFIVVYIIYIFVEKDNSYFY